ncbi:MAG TPA: thioesterase family protein [Ohtaekwangia sp.]|uniref:acyl-CoA thioesterase n=1 Tax=Ohtaekwangia sp. TaxID=2066019 RepID=UPI002F928A7C
MKSTPFEHRIIASASDIDELGHVNNVVYVRYIQEVAAAHWNNTASEVLKAAYLWVVLRHEIDYKNPAFLHDKIIGTTWVGEHHGARFERFVKLVRAADQKVLVESKTMWCLLDSKSMRPVRIGEDILGIL